jgi:hypothetical protein
MEALASLSDDADHGDPNIDSGNELILDALVKRANWPKGKNWGRSASMLLARQPVSPIRLI